MENGKKTFQIKGEWKGDFSGSIASLGEAPPMSTKQSKLVDADSEE